MGNSRARTLGLRIGAAVLAVLAIVWGSIAYQLGRSRDTLLDHARQEGETLSSAVAEQFASYAGIIDLWVRHMRNEWRRDPRHFAGAVALEKALLGGGSMVVQTAIIDRHGWMVFSDAPNAPGRLYLGDRAHFKAHAGPGPVRDRLYISDPVIGRASGKRSIQFTRPILGPAGEFAGVIVISVSPQQLITVYKDITLGPRAFVTLRRPTGEVVVSSNPYELVAHRPFPVIAHAPGDPLQGSYVRRADTDGIERLFTYRRIPEHDLVVVVGRSLDEILAPYYEQRRVYVAGGTLLSAVLLLLALLAYRRMRREAEANESLRRFRFAMDNSADIIVLVDRATMRHVDANDTACRLLGYTREELLAMGPSGILPYSGEQLAAIYDDLIANPAVRSGMRSYYRCKDGTQLPFESTRKLLRTPQGPLVVAISRDMREHIASEEALRRHGEQLAGILALQGRLADEKLDLRGICDLVVDSTRRLLGTGAAAIQFVEGEEFVYFAASAERKQLVGVRTGLRGNFSAAILESGKAILCDDTQTDPRIDAAASARAGARSLIGAPMHHQGRVVGILKLISGEPRAFHAEQLGTLELLAGIAGSAIQRKRAQDELRRSEERFRSLANLSSDWYWEQDANLRFTKFEGKPGDKRLANVPTEVLGRCAWQLGGIVREAADWDSLRRSMLAHQPFRQFEYCYESRAGARHYVSADGEPVFDEHGAFSGYRGTARDITEQRRDEEALRRFRAAMDMSHDAVFLTDRATLRFVDVNEPAWKGTGYTREELMRIGPERVLGKPREELEREYDAVIAAGEAGITVETSYRSAKGRTRWTELQRRPLRAGDRWIIVTVSRDITERKRAEELQKRHLRLQERTARFGQAALAKRDAAELIEEGVAALLEGLTADGVAYIEAVAGGGLVLRELAGLSDAPSAPCPVESAAAGLREVFEPGRGRRLAAGAELGLPWAAAFESAAAVPVRSEGTVRGALCALRRAPDAFTVEELNFAEAVAGVLATALQRVDSESKLAFLAQFDTLTGLPNRALLRDRFSVMIVQARRRGTQLGVLFVDLDEFKLVNDSLGHAAGDALLQQVARRLQSAVRAGDTVARIAGDEFAVILGDLGRVEDAALVAQKLIDRLTPSYDVGGQEIFVTASVGIAAFPGDGDDAEALLAAADAAMYKAKQGGRNSYQFFTAEITQRTRARAVIGTELRRALEREEFTVYYQPKIDLQARRVCGAEALLRWNHPQRGLVPPAEFISVLEETGLIVPAGEWALARACADLDALRGSGAAPLGVAVNLSARQFRLQDLAERVRGIVQAARVEPRLVELEITESQLMHDPQHAADTVRELSEAGMRIAIDDFGTGYSSLAYLSRFRVTSLKIDRSFVAGMMTRKGDEAIVRAILYMARALGFTVVAEGVETQAQADFLSKLRCDQAQGYLFAKPMPVAELRRFVAAPLAA